MQADGRIDYFSREKSPDGNGWYFGTYSKRDGTASCELSEEVDEKTKKIRVDKFLELSNILEKEYKAKFIGKILKVLVEEEKDDYSYGYTDNYIRVILKGNYKHKNIYDIMLNENNVVVDSKNKKI